MAPSRTRILSLRRLPSCVFVSIFPLYEGSRIPGRPAKESRNKGTEMRARSFITTVGR